MSGATRLPFVFCDEETFDDEIFLYYRADDAKEKAKELQGKRYASAVVKLEDKQLLAFYTSLYTMGVNCLAVNSGTDTEISIQLSDLVIRRKPEELPEGKRPVENPALHLTAIYFMQEMRRQAEPQPTEELNKLQEELLAHYGKGTFVAAVREDGSGSDLETEGWIDIPAAVYGYAGIPEICPRREDEDGCDPCCEDSGNLGRRGKRGRY